VSNDQIYGGFGGVLPGMSEQLQARIRAEEVAEARELARERRERAQRAEEFQQSNIQGAIAMALERGENFNPRWLRGERLGNTVSEAIQRFSGMQDLEDVRAQLQERKEFEQWKLQRSESMSGDASAHVVEAERAEREKQETRRREDQMSSAVRRYVKRQTVQEARKAALHDTLTVVTAADRDRRG
jgi:dynactin complex subunit